MSFPKTSSWIFLILVASFVSCSPKPILYEKGGAIAVWDVDNLSPLTAGQPDLGPLLSSQIVEVLKKKGDHTVVERERLLLALEELRLGTTSLVDETARLTLGKIVGARWMIFGGYQILGNRMRLDLRLVQVETGKVLKAVQRTTSASDWIDGARKAAEDLL